MEESIPTYEVIANHFNEHPVGIFECPCGLRHRHGLPETINEPEHRVAHCDTKLHPRGYFIVWRGKTDGVKPDRSRTRG